MPIWGLFFLFNYSVNSTLHLLACLFEPGALRQLTGCSRTHYVTNTGLDLLIRLPQPPCAGVMCIYSIFTIS